MFKSRLQQSGCDFICNTQLPASVALISFLGSFQGRIVLWNMSLSTLPCHRLVDTSTSVTEKSALQSRPFIEIKADGEGIYTLKIGLGLQEIDGPAIKKAIIMVRNYKRLKIGLTEFGMMHT